MISHDRSRFAFVYGLSFLLLTGLSLARDDTLLRSSPIVQLTKEEAAGKNELLSTTMTMTQQQRNLETYDSPYSYSDTYTTTTSKNWFQRLVDSFVSVLVGIVLFIASPVLLFWNEGRAVKRMKQIKFVAENTRTNIVSNKFTNDEQLVHVVGRAQPAEAKDMEYGDARRHPLLDPIFGIPPSEGNHLQQDILVLKRHVQMYQWVERTETQTEKTAGGGSRTTTTYHYDKEWAGYPVDSARFEKFGYDNPVMKFQDETFFREGGVELELRQSPYSEGITKFSLSDQLHHQIPANQSYDINQDGPTDPSWMDDLGSRLANSGKDYGSVGLGSPARWADSTTLEFGPQPVDIGTHRVSWSYFKPGTVSVLAKQSSNRLVEWDGDGFTICRLALGEQTLGDMVRTMELENTAMMWMLRIVGCVLWGIALQGMAKPLEVVFDLGTVPFLGFEPGTIVSYLTGVAAFIFALCLSLITIAVAWVVYRPLVGITLLATAVAIMYLLPKPEATTVPESTIPDSGGGEDVVCPGGSLSACASTICSELADQAYKICVENCITKCA